MSPQSQSIFTFTVVQTRRVGRAKCGSRDQSSSNLGLIGFPTLLRLDILVDGGQGNNHTNPVRGFRS